MGGLGGGFVNLPNSKAGEAGLALERRIWGGSHRNGPSSCDSTPLQQRKENLSPSDPD